MTHKWTDRFSSEGRRLIAVAVIALSCDCSYGAEPAHSDTANLTVSGDQISLAIVSPRPVAKAVEALNAEFNYFITYEDPRYAYAGDFQDVTAAVRKDLEEYNPGEAPKVLVPKGGELTIHAAKDPASALAAVTRSQWSADGGGRFAVIETDGIFHVVPTAVRNVDGKWMDQVSILDAPISIRMDELTDAQMIEYICSAVGAANQVKVIANTSALTVSSLPYDQAKHYAITAEQEPGRSVLLRALKLIRVDRGRSTWLLYYDPHYGGGSYVLNLEPLPVSQSAAAPVNAAQKAAVKRSDRNASDVPP